MGIIQPMSIKNLLGVKCLTEYSKCKHTRIQGDNTGNEQRYRCMDCGRYGKLVTKDFFALKPNEASKNFMRFELD